MSNLLIPLLAFVSVVAFGGALLGGILSMKNPLRTRLRALGGGSRAPEQTGLFGRTLARAGASISKEGKSSTKLRNEMSAAGFYNPNALGIFWGSKILLFVFGLLSFGVLVTVLDFPFQQEFLMLTLGSGVLFCVPNIILGSYRRKRRAEIQCTLPDAIDLLEICVSGGMGLDMAWNAVAEDFRHVSAALADEMSLTNLEMQLGAGRGDAMRHMANRTGAKEISSLVAVLVQTERFGTSVAEALRIFATNMRDLRSERAEEASEKMAIKLLLPLILLIFPVVLIVSVGPAIIILVEVLG